MKVESTAAHVFQMIIPKVTIMPGINFVENAIAKDFLAHPHVQARIKSGFLKVLDDKVDNIEGAMGNYKSLIKDIPSILDIKLLEKIKAEDKRPSIIKAVETQLAKLREDRKEEDFNK